MRLLLVVVHVAALAVVLSGCKSTEEIAQADNADCVSLGAAMGSQGYVDCRLRLREMRDRRRAAAANDPVTCQAAGPSTTICY